LDTRDGSRSTASLGMSRVLHAAGLKGASLLSPNALSPQALRGGVNVFRWVGGGVGGGQLAPPPGTESTCGVIEPSESLGTRARCFIGLLCPADRGFVGEDMHTCSLTFEPVRVEAACRIVALTAVREVMSSPA
jgi:hypothetical protein